VLVNTKLRNALFVTIILVGTLIIAVSMMTGCASTSGGTQGDGLSAAEKAAQDSIARAKWDRQLNLNWSLGFENHENKLYRAAIPYFWKVVDLDTVKRFSDLYTFLGGCYMNLNIPDSAEIIYEMGTQRFPKKTHYHRSLAWLLAAKSQNERAIDEYNAALDLDPENLNDLKAVGNLLISEDRTDEAISVYEKIIKLDPKNGEVQNVYAQLLGSTGDEDAVLNAKINASNTNPQDTNLLFQIGEIYFKQNDYENSIIYFNKLLAINAQDAMALEYVGNSQQNLGKFKEAIATYEKVIAIQQDNKKIVCEMATCYKDLGQLSKSRSVANQALKIDPAYGLAFIVRGEVYEVAVDQCLEKRGNRQLKFDDKLIYKKAYDEYAKAKKDLEFADFAQRKMSFVQPDIPTKEDLFMHQGVTKAKLACYNWIY
jgi:tetratricopeptide (TPR) repeat protein